MAIYLATYSLDIAALFYLLSMIRSGTSLSRERHMPFTFGIVLTIVIILAEAGTIYASTGGINLRLLHIAFNLIGFSLSPLIPIAIIAIFDRSLLTEHKFLLLPTFVNLGATILSPVFRLIFYVDSNNEYMRGSLFFIFIVVFVFNYFVLVMSTLDIEKKHQYPIKRKMMALFMFTIFGTSIQLINPLIYASWHCVTLTLFLYFLLMSEFDSSFDALSGLYNRAAMERMIEGFDKAKSLTVVVLDINDFKQINDTYGHDYGDRVIKQVASVIRESLGKHFKCYRFGGDEFVAVSIEGHQEKLDHQIRRITKTISSMRENGQIVPTVSIGHCSKSGNQPIGFHELLKEADEKMYQQKRKSC